MSALYDPVILFHARSEKNRGEVEEPRLRGRGFNPACGDEIFLSLRIEGERISHGAWTGEGCAVCLASASLAVEGVRGLDRQEALDKIRAFYRFVGDETNSPGPDLDPAAWSWGEAAALKPAFRLPGRKDCVLLAWRTLEGLIAGPAAETGPAQAGD
ncbi:MAG: SUF system NifU family Fe-S cluster assembly protein [Spirochaetales bacterium]|jgi:nitrogen fixation NifU-like protein|nr:SUF system NifU family Fe-S cluster assembly protein [Spirochaetales bacterium]